MKDVHVLAYRSKPAPHFLVRGPAGVGQLDLAGRFDWRVGPVRTCVGRWNEAGHAPCPSAEPLAIHSQCDACSGLEDRACIFEPRCGLDPAGCHCVATFKGVPHVVYVAFFGTLPKVGMTQARRLDARLREQGADAGFVAQGHARGEPAVPLDRAGARQAERALSFLHGLPEHRSHRETLPQLARPVPWTDIERRAADWMERLAPRFNVERTLRRIEDHPVRQPLAAVPRRVPAAGHHHGVWLGAKGQNLLYAEADRADRLPAGARAVAVKAGDLTGRRLTVAG